MPYRLLADAVLLLHLGWGFLVEATGAICPLTWAELYFRRLAGEAGYEGGFVDHYLLPLIYPAGLTRELQIGLGVGVLAVNALLYAWIWRRGRSPA